MKVGFVLDARVRTNQGGKPQYGTLVAREDATAGEHSAGMPHYTTEAFYCVKWDGFEETRLVHEDDLVLHIPHRPLHKTTIVIWSESDTSNASIEVLAQMATSGDMYCSKSESEEVEDPACDPDWDGTEFFQAEDEPEEPEEQPDLDEFFCAQCQGEQVKMGVLGNRAHYRCRRCGWEESKINGS